MRKHILIKAANDREQAALAELNRTLPFSVAMTPNPGEYLCDVGNLANDAKQWALSNCELYPWQQGLVVALSLIILKGYGNDD